MHRAIVDKNEIMAGFDLEQSADILQEVWSAVQGLAATRPSTDGKIAVNENKQIHGFLKRIFNEIERVALKNGRSVNKYFHEHWASTTTGHRPDFLFTGPREQEHAFLNTLFYLEGKVPQSFTKHAGTGNTDVALGREVLLESALFQCIRLIAHRHEQTGRRTSHGIGVASNGTDIQFVRINFSLHTTHGLFPCFVTPIFNMFDHSAEGLLWLLHLMLDTDPERFGLPKHLLSVPLVGYTPGPLLGSGGFGNVIQLSRESDGNQFACKFMRNDLKTNYLQDEARCLNMLQGLNNIPTLVHTLKDSDDQVVALITEPVGETLRHWVEKQDKESPQFHQDIGHIFNQLVAILGKVHDKGWVHEDIRPSNIIVRFSSEKGPEVFLIDWGLAAQIGTTRANRFGEPGFLSESRFRNWILPYSEHSKETWKVHPTHDLEALALTFLSITDSCKPFEVYACNECEFEKKDSYRTRKIDHHLTVALQQRNAWIEQRLTCVRDDDIRNTLNSLLGRPAEEPKRRRLRLKKNLTVNIFMLFMSKLIDLLFGGDASRLCS
eukprot:GILJ01014789.1.p1 GENE.GILJ01014789.1~~GILJ01014789.1.p1  ORF type:complete len:550 (-),score=28.26 GILJ01014789.1:37-1686(-)